MIVTEPRCWIVFHSEPRFKDEYALRDWLAGGLKKDQGGYYYLNRQFGVSPGSILLFGMKGLLVGSAIAKEAIRKLTEEEKAGGEFRCVLRVVPDSIWIWKEPFVSLKALRVKGLDIPEGGGPQIEISASDALKIFEIVCQDNVG